MTEPVTTTFGPVAGTVEGGVHVFRGIPYATAGRFRAPAPPPAWTDVADASAFGAACPQPAMTLAGSIGGEQERQDEDCLVLNVFTPKPDSDGRPVMVWFHGGAWTSGSGSSPMYDGRRLATRGDVVVVTVNHRLGYLGFLYLSELGGEEYADSGNAGALDMRASLEWVRDNIAAFGGDPGNVTIFGESGGGWKICTLLGMASAAGLFHRAVVQSGPLIRAVDPTEATATAKTMMDRLGVTSVGDLVEVPTDAFLAAQAELIGGALGGAGSPLGPVLDGRTFTRHFFDPDPAPTSRNIPLLIGSCRDEMTLFSLVLDPGRFSERGLTQRAAREFGDDHEKVLDVYRRQRPGASPFELYIAFSSDRFRVGSIRIAERRADTGRAPVFMYRFDYESSAMGGRLGASHGIDIGFVFDNLDVPGLGLVEPGPTTQALADQTSEAWLAFARTGDPNHSGLPAWPQYDSSRRATMIFDTDCRVVDDPDAEERRAWDHVAAPM